MVPFDSLGTVSYSHFIVTMALILYHFRDKARYCCRIAISYTPCIRHPISGSPTWNITIPFGVEKLEWCGYPTVKKPDDVFSHFNRKPARHGQTDRQTDRRLAIAESALCVASSGINDESDANTVTRVYTRTYSTPGMQARRIHPTAR